MHLRALLLIRVCLVLSMSVHLALHYITGDYTHCSDWRNNTYNRRLKSAAALLVQHPNKRGFSSDCANCQRCLTNMFIEATLRCKRRRAAGFQLMEE